MASSDSKFTIVDALTLLVLAVVLIGGVFFATTRQRSRGGHRPMQSNTQVRGIHQSMVMYAQSNNSYYPGFDPTGAIVDATVEHRYKVLLHGNYFTGEYAISPAETKTEWTTGAVTSDNYSFAMLDIDAGGGRAEEWSETLNTEAPVMSDRNTGSDAAANVQSVHTASGDWRGSVAWNDNHTVFEATHLLEETRYGSGALNKNDNLFDAPTADDALMIYSGD